MKFNRIQLMVIAVPFICLLCAGTYFLPPVYDRVAWRLEDAWLWVQYRINPPAKDVFVPAEAPVTLVPLVTVVGAAVEPGLPPAATDNPAPDGGTRTAAEALAATPNATEVLVVTGAGALSTPQVTDTPTPIPTPTVTATPLPEQVSLQGVRYEDQHGRWNYCAPANLAMALSYWNWIGDRDVVGPILKPLEKDKNVMPYEMVDYITIQTTLNVAHRSGGDLDLLRRMIAAGFPVLVERGVYLRDLTGVISWMGHYQVLTGYDQAAQTFTAQDSYVKANLPVSYDELITGWRSFNYTYLVIYPPEREAEVMALLGPDADPAQNNARTAGMALDETAVNQGAELYFAWFNRGTSLVAQDQYAEAALAYDQAFQVYQDLPEKDRPWRMLWYQTGPYFAYYYSQRYNDLLALTNATLDTMQGEKNLEESYYWRGLAEYALGDPNAAVEDLLLALKYHPGFGPALLKLQEWGV